jgi:hypothetical protein
VTAPSASRTLPLGSGDEIVDGDAERVGEPLQGGDRPLPPAGFDIGYLNGKRR